MKKTIALCLLVLTILIGGISADAKTSKKGKGSKSLRANTAVAGKFTAYDDTYTLLANGKIKSPRGRLIGTYEKKGDGSYYEIVMDDGDWYVIYMFVGNKVYSVGGGTDGLGIEKFTYNPSDKTVSVVNTTDLDDAEFMEYNAISSLRAPLSEFEVIGTVTWK